MNSTTNYENSNLLYTIIYFNLFIIIIIIILNLQIQNNLNLSLIKNLRKETDEINYLFDELRKETDENVIVNKVQFNKIMENTRDIVLVSTRDGFKYTTYTLPTITFNWIGDKENVACYNYNYGSISVGGGFKNQMPLFKEFKHIKNITFNFITDEESIKVDEITCMSMVSYKTCCTEHEVLFEIINSILEVNTNVILTFNYNIPPSSIIENLKFLENINKIIFVRDDGIYFNSLFTASLIKKSILNLFDNSIHKIDISLNSNGNIIQIQ